MKKLNFGKSKLLLIFIFCLMLCPLSGISAYAEEPEVAALKKIELSKAEVFLPQPIVHGEWNYTIDLFSSDDTQMSSPLAENVLKYAFREPGDYILKYTFISGGETLVKTSELTVQDTTAPKINAVQKTEKNYLQGKEVGLFVKISDNGQLNAVTLRIYLDGNDITEKEGIPQQLPSEKESEYGINYKLDRAGRYKAIVTATDLSGNSADFTFEFTVGQNGSLPGWGIALICAGGALILAAVAIAVVLILKRKGKNHAEN